MRRVDPPYFGLARFVREWVPLIHFTRSRERGEYGGEVVERYGGDGPDQKEYWTIRVDDANWLLMRCYYPCGVSLDTDRPEDLPAFEAIARAVGARQVGWRYRWRKFRDRLS